jgi:hypothetical protein
MNRFTFILLFAFTAQSGYASKTHKAHVHGEGKFFLTQEGNELEVALEIPADSVVGFEHAPRTKKQKAAIKRAKKTFKNPKAFIAFPKKAKCRFDEVEVEAPHEDDHDQHHHSKKKDDHHHGEKHDDHDVHSEFHAEYEIKCKNPKAVTSVTVTLFSSFKGIREMHAKAVLESGQFQQKLTGKSNTFKLGK